MPSPPKPAYDALLVVSFGGPEGPEEVLPFLENVLRGRNIPRARLEEVAEHYQLFGGVSPLNAQNRALVGALEAEFAAHELSLPVYWGNRNWHPLLAETIRQMRDDGVRRALAFVTSAYSSYSGCRQYRENIEAARQEVGAEAPQVDKLRVFYNHPAFIETMIERAGEALQQVPAERQKAARWLFSAHSIPKAMADGCRYEAQLREASRLVSGGLGVGPERWQLVYQSRSGPPQQPWLEPDVCDALRELYEREQPQDVIIVPIGFTSDHMEVIYDLGVEAQEVADELGVNLVRAGTAGTHPKFIGMIRQLVEERMSEHPERLALGSDGPSHDVCPEDCCLYQPQRPGGS